MAARMRSARYYGREATARLPQPEHDRQRSEALPDLKVITRRRPRWGLALLAMVFVGVLLGALIVAPVLVSSAATGLEAEVGQMEAEERSLATATSALAAQISALSSSERVAEQAEQLGLRPAESVSYMQIGSDSPAMEGDTTVAGR